MTLAGGIHVSQTHLVSYRKYIPQLSKFPTQYIYEPWTAPKAVQEKVGCIIGRDYPRPIVDHDTIRKVNIERMAAAYNSRPGKGENSPGKHAGKSLMLLALRPKKNYVFSSGRTYPIFCPSPQKFNCL